MDRQVADLVMTAEAVGHGVFRLFAHGATAHHMGTAQAGAVELQAQTVDQRARFGQGFDVASIGMHRHHCIGATGKLDFGHAVERPAQAVPGIGRNLIVEHRGVVTA